MTGYAQHGKCCAGDAGDEIFSFQKRMLSLYDVENEFSGHNRELFWQAARHVQRQAQSSARQTAPGAHGCKARCISRLTLLAPR